MDVYIIVERRVIEKVRRIHFDYEFYTTTTAKSEM